MRWCQFSTCVLSWNPRLHPEPHVGYALSESQEWLEESDSEEDSSSDEEGAEGEDGDQEEDSAEEGAGEGHSRTQLLRLPCCGGGPPGGVCGGWSKQVAVQCSLL